MARTAPPEQATTVPPLLRTSAVTSCRNRWRWSSTASPFSSLPAGGSRRGGTDTGGEPFTGKRGRGTAGGPSGRLRETCIRLHEHRYMLLLILHQKDALGLGIWEGDEQPEGGNLTRRPPRPPHPWIGALGPPGAPKKFNPCSRRRRRATGMTETGEDLDPCDRQERWLWVTRGTSVLDKKAHELRWGEGCPGPGGCGGPRGGRA